MARSPRTAQAAQLSEAIKATAWQQIADAGAANLSLRAIARALHITAPAIYNYYPRRDDLITALIIDAFTALGDSQLAARDAVPAEDLVERMMAIGQAYRRWALAYPQRYQLIFGAPPPGYVVPIEQIRPAAARSMSALVSGVEAIRQAGRLHSAGFPQLVPDATAPPLDWKHPGGGAHPLSFGIAIYIWSCVHGLVSLEIAGNLPPFGPDGAALFQYAQGALTQQFITDT